MATTKALELSQLAKGITVDANGDITAISVDTDVITEGSSNLYYTSARFDTDLSGKTTDNLTEGSTNQYYTDVRARSAISATGDISYNSSTGVISFTETAETVTSVSYNSSTTILTYTDENGATTNIDLSGLLDEDNRSIASGTLNSSTGIVTFTRDDASTFTLDLSALLDDTNLVTSVNGAAGVVVLDSDDISEGSTNLYYTDARAQAVSINNVVEDTTPQLGGTLDANGQDIDMGTNTITDTKVGQWDTAYGWGDHSLAGYLTGSDPAASITNTDISNWNTAYGWGDHSLAGYLTSFTETDPIFQASAAAGISATSINNWDTAYNWGDHSTAGYGTIDDATALAIALG